LFLNPAALWATETEAVAVGAIEKLGGHVVRDKEGAVIKITLHHAEIANDDLKHLAVLTTIRELDLSATKVGDVGLKHLAGLRGLTTLNLAFTGVKDAGLKELAPLRELTSLDLSGNYVTDAGL